MNATVSECLCGQPKLSCPPPWGGSGVARVLQVDLCQISKLTFWAPELLACSCGGKAEKCLPDVYGKYDGSELASLPAGWPRKRQIWVISGHPTFRPQAGFPKRRLQTMVCQSRHPRSPQVSAQCAWVTAIHWLSHDFLREHSFTPQIKRVLAFPLSLSVPTSSFTKLSPKNLRGRFSPSMPASKAFLHHTFS